MSGPWLYLTEAATGDLQRLHQTADLSVVHCAASIAEKTFPQAVNGLLKAMGKDENVTGMRMHPSDGVNVLPAWLTAHETQIVLLSRAQVWQKPVILSELVRLLAATPTTVVVATDPGLPGQVASTLRGMCPTPIPVEELPELLPIPAEITQPTTQHLDLDLRVEVPASDWGTFRYDCRNSLTSEAFSRVDAAYVAGVTTTRHALAESAPTNDSTVALLTRILHDNEDTAATTAAFRGAQAAYFQAGYNLRLDPRTLIGLHAHSRPPEFTDRDWLALRAYRDPARPATCTLHAYGLTIRQIRQFTVDDAESVLALGHIAARPLNRHAVAFLTANLMHRSPHGAHSDAPFIPHKDIGRVLTDAGRDVGILTAGKPAHTSDHTRAIWTAGTGFLLKEVT